MENVILYGAGINLPYFYSELKDKYNILCATDKNKNKQCKEIVMSNGKKIFIFSIENALTRFENAKIFITPSVPVKYEIIKELIEKYNINEDRILNYEAVTYKRGCELAETMLTFGPDFIKVCCTGYTAPHIDYKQDKTNEEFLADLEKFRDATINSIATGNESPLCKGCQYIKDGFYFDKRRINRINFAPGGSCQFNCYYCNEAGYYKEPPNKESIKKAVSFLAFLRSRNYFEENTKISLVNGEIMISPYRKEIFETVEGFKLEIATNGEFFSKEVEVALRTGNAVVNISVDSGTIETFKMAKGRDCFDKVVENIHKYGEVAQTGALQLKYIILPGINDNKADAQGFASLASDVKADIVMSRDMYNVKNFDDNIESCLITAQTIISEARKNKLIVFNQLNDFSPPSKYRERIERMFNDL